MGRNLVKGLVDSSTNLQGQGELQPNLKGAGREEFGTKNAYLLSRMHFAKKRWRVEISPPLAVYTYSPP